MSPLSEAPQPSSQSSHHLSTVDKWSSMREMDEWIIVIDTACWPTQARGEILQRRSLNGLTSCHHKGWVVGVFKCDKVLHTYWLFWFGQLRWNSWYGSC
ncbi:hypothetical protein BDV34DRAFT_185754 [Aspergillus parasiticus]|uniref:Uncharacterized protein n=1 Tax=Aspergillus parasiticus TaxID=5067 RepID=A0A5N6E0Z1_ASPPA|nr:hypothetical protein BDV34DRAFT_185754 [Aspergillus parasiticus]